MRTISQLTFVIVLLSALIGEQRAEAATVYVDGNLAATCSGTVYSFAGRNCSGSNGAGYKTVREGIRALDAGDVLLIRAGTYNMSGTYGNVSTDTYGCNPTCPTSWATATRISNYPGEVVIMNGGSFNMDNDLYPNGLSYLIWQGDNRSNFITQNGSGTGLRVNNAVHHIRIDTMTIRNWSDFGIQGGTSTSCTKRMNTIQVLNLEVRSNGNNGDPTNGNQTHGVYPTCGDNWLIDGSYFVDNWGYGIHANGFATSAAFTNLIITNNIVEGRMGPCCSVSGQTAGGIVVTAGNGTLVANNVVIGKGSATNYLQVGIQASYHNVTGVKIYNNTIYDVATGVQTQDASATVISNNIFSNVTDSIDNVNVAGVTGTKNLCSSNDTTVAGACSVVTSSPGFVNAAALDFRLLANSPAINAGISLSSVTTDCAGVTRPQGPAYDIGAYEGVGGSDSSPPSAPVGLNVQ